MKNIFSLLVTFLLVIGVAYTQAQLKEVENVRLKLKTMEAHSEEI